jgi:hypothetical protein
MRMTRLLSAAGLLAALFASGCSNRPPLAQVTGKVTLNGKPLGNVRVAFHPDPDKGTTGPGSSGVTDAEGNFALKFEDGSPGAIVGHHRVLLNDLDVFGNVFVGRGDYRSEDPKGGKAEVPKKPRFAAVYTDLANTPVRLEVKAGLPPVAIEVK